MEKAWWKEAEVYQVYPRSFCDQNGDGIGDLPGILTKLDYLKDLGVDVLWLSPVYQSPNDDNGYDISDYKKIMKEFGSLEDWDQLLKQTHARGMRLIMDLVVNHTSDEHPWFIESQKSRDNPYRDYYIWRDSVNGGPPNNWESIFSGSAWQYDPPTDQYYLHLFSKKQPDLNWSNPKVREEIYNLMEFWFTRGIDGFRIDVMNMYAKDMSFPNAPVKNDRPFQKGFKYHVNLPKNHEYLHEMYQRVLSRYDCMTVGEASFTSPQEGIKYTDPSRQELNMIIQFEHMGIDTEGEDKYISGAYRPLDLKRALTRWQYALNGKGWNCNYLSNHDQPRQVSRFGDDKNYRYESACMLGALSHTLQGTPFIYQGEELGMTNIKMERFEDFRDVELLNWLRVHSKLPGFDLHKALERANYISRDHARTPMQWTDSENAGFTSGTPWIKLNPNYRQINAREQLQNPHSVLSFYKKLIALRKNSETLIYGEFEDLLPDHEDIYYYKRALNGEEIYIILNLTDKLIKMDPYPPKGKVLLSNYCGKPIWEEGQLHPFEAQIFRKE